MQPLHDLLHLRVTAGVRHWHPRPRPTPAIHGHTHPYSQSGIQYLLADTDTAYCFIGVYYINSI